jgi:hypothetical protein
LLLAGAALPASVSAYGQCVTDTLVVDACLGGVRRTVPAGMTFERNFLTGSLGAGAVFTRASTGTYYDSGGVPRTAAINAPRFDYDPTTLQLKGLLLEDASTNLLLNSGALSTQSVTVAAQSYALSFYGTGTITLSGASTAGPLVGAGASPSRVSLIFTATAGLLTCTVTGSVVNAQLDTVGYTTSYIPTLGAAVTRAADVLSYPIAGVTGFDQTKGSLSHEYILEGSASQYAATAQFIGAAPATDYISPEQFDATGTPITPSVNAAAASVGATLAYCILPATSAAAGPSRRSASGWSVGNVMHAAHDGVGDTGNSGPVTALPVITSLTIAGTMHTQYPVSQWARRTRYWPRQLSQAELIGGAT